MTLNSLKKNVKKMERKAGMQNLKIVDLLGMIHKEVHSLINHRLNEKEVGRELIDIQVILLQLASRYGTNLNGEWKKHWKEFKKKYLSKKPIKKELKKSRIGLRLSRLRK